MGFISSEGRAKLWIHDVAATVVNRHFPTQGIGSFMYDVSGPFSAPEENKKELQAQLKQNARALSDGICADPSCHHLVLNCKVVFRIELKRRYPSNQSAF